MKPLSFLTLALAAASLVAQPPAPQHTHLKVGDVAPDFTLPDNNNHPVKLSDFRGKKNVVLAFSQLRLPVVEPGNSLPTSLVLASLTTRTPRYWPSAAIS